MSTSDTKSTRERIRTMLDDFHARGVRYEDLGWALQARGLSVDAKPAAILKALQEIKRER